MSQSSEFCHRNPLCCFSTRVYFRCCLFRYQLSPETFGYTLVYQKHMQATFREKFPTPAGTRTPRSSNQYNMAVMQTSKMGVTLVPSFAMDGNFSLPTAEGSFQYMTKVRHWKTALICIGQIHIYEIDESVTKSFRTGRLERELQMVQLSATRSSCIAIL
jgi:hypothetical protein